MFVDHMPSSAGSVLFATTSLIFPAHATSTMLVEEVCSPFCFDS